MDSTADPRTRPIIIVGMDRSGTSMVANLVHRWGAYGGNPEQLAQGNVGNIHGYWENELLGGFNRVLSRDAEVPEFWDRAFADTLVEKASDPHWRGVAEGLVSMLAGEDRIWFWKEPDISLYLPFWKRIWGEATYVITVRNPCDSALSWQDFEVPDHARSTVSTVAATLLRWQVMMTSILEHTQGTHRIFIPYENLMHNPNEQCRRLYDFLSDIYAVDRLDDAELAEASQVVDPRSWRNRASVPFADLDVATPEQKDLYELVLAMVDNPETPFDAARYPMYAGWREYLQNLDTLKEMLYDQMPGQAPHRNARTWD